MSTLVVRETSLADWSDLQIVEEIHREHVLVEEAVSEAFAHAIRAGEMLLEMQKRVLRDEPGMWQKWANENVNISQRLVQDYMRWARHKELLFAAGITSGRKAKHFLLGVAPEFSAHRARAGARRVLGDVEVAEVHRLAAEGWGDRKIAREMNVSPGTVWRYLNPEAAKARALINNQRQVARRRELRRLEKIAAEKKTYLAAKRAGRPEPRALDQAREIRDVFRRVEADAPKGSEYRRLAGKLVVLMNEAEDTLLAAMHREKP